jgi:hypothetical protein
LNRKKLVGAAWAASAVVVALVYFFVVVPRVIYGSAGVKVKTVAVDFGDLDGAVVVDVGKGCENVYLEPASLRAYVTDCWGNVHLVDGPSREELRLVKSAKVGDGKACGIGRGPGGYLYVAASDDWLGRGGGIYRVDRALESAAKIAGDYPGLNGLALDPRGDVYFAASNMSFINGEGAIYKMSRKAGGDYCEAEVFLRNLRCADGVFYDARAGRICFTETFSGASTFNPGSTDVTGVLGKAALFDFCDDLCTDARGRYWLADPGGFLKCFDAEAGELTRYRVNGCGRPASCRIRLEGGEEVIYVTELKRRGGPASSLSKKCDGRGVVVIPLKELTKAGQDGSA